MQEKTTLLKTILRKMQACSGASAMVVVGLQEFQEEAPNTTAMIAGIPLDSFHRMQMCCTLLKNSTFNREEAQQIKEAAQDVMRRFPNHKSLIGEMDLLIKEVERQ